ncbi:MAG: hypothetical protein IJE59_05550 [Clostridia bacterium]|nr:hypothetical protein [Clostridia bacterium]
MSESSVFNSDINNQFNVFKLSAKGFTLEQIHKIFELDDYFSTQGIGKNGDFVKFLSQAENVLYHNSFERNMQVVLKYQNNPVFNRIAERLRCSTVEDYYTYILSVRELESFCDTYTSTPRNLKNVNYKRNQNGHAILEPKDYLLTNIPATQGTREGKWYLLSNRTRVFIKNVCSIREAYSELVSEEIAKQMGIPGGSYDLIDMGGLLKIASINILETGEELIHGFDILNDPKVKNIDLICSSLCRKLKNNYPNMSAEDIQKIKEDFLKITIFDKIIGNWDRNPGNWGLIVSPDGKVRLCPEFDNNRALSLKGFDFDKDMNVDGKHNIETLLEYCLNNFSNSTEFLSFVERCVKNVNVKDAATNILNKKGISLPQSEIQEMEFVVHGRATQQMRHWIEDKKKLVRKPTDLEDAYTK